jgi:P27 family predicted phage terminase small subunit
MKINKFYKKKELKLMARPPKINKNVEDYKKSKEVMDRIEDNTPAYLTQKFIYPKTLNKKEKIIWDWLTTIFTETKGSRVSDADVHLMEAYCRAKVAADEADKSLKKDPSSFILVALEKDKDGKATKTTLKANPNILKRKENTLLFIKLSSELGLSPLARAKAGLASANPKNKIDLFDKLNSRNDEE